MENRQNPAHFPPVWLPSAPSAAAAGQATTPGHFYQYAAHSAVSRQTADQFTYSSVPGQAQFECSSDQSTGQAAHQVRYGQFVHQVQPVMQSNSTPLYPPSNENYPSTPSNGNCYPSAPSCGNTYPSTPLGGNSYPSVPPGGNSYPLTPVLTQASVLIPPSPGASATWLPPQSYSQTFMSQANIAVQASNGGHLFCQPPPQLLRQSTNGQDSIVGYNQTSLTPMQVSATMQAHNGSDLFHQPPPQLLRLSSNGQDTTVSYNQYATPPSVPPLSKSHGYGGSSNERVVVRTIVPMHPVQPQISRQGSQNVSVSLQTRPQISQQKAINSSSVPERGNENIIIASVVGSNQMQSQADQLPVFSAPINALTGFPYSQTFTNVNVPPPSMQPSTNNYGAAHNRAFAHASQSAESPFIKQQYVHNFNSGTAQNSSAQLTPFNQSVSQTAAVNYTSPEPISSKVDRRSCNESDQNSYTSPISKQNNHSNNNGKNIVTSRKEYGQKGSHSLEFERFDSKGSDAKRSSYSGSVCSNHEEDLFPMPNNGTKDLFTGSNEDDLFTDIFDRDYIQMSPNSPTRDDLFPKPPIPIARDSPNALKRSISEVACNSNSGDNSKKVRYHKSVESLDEHKSSAKPAVRRASSAAKQMEVTIAAKGTAQSAATFKVFKCDFCRCTTDTVASMDAHLVTSKHLSGSEFGARTGSNECTELVYVARILLARNGRVSNKSLVIACPSCRAVFDDIFTCALHHKYEHSQWPDSSTVNINKNFERFGKQSTSLTFGQASDLDKVSLGSALYSLCPVISFETVTLPFDQDLDCSQCKDKFPSHTSLFSHWDSDPSHQPVISKSDNAQIFVLSVCSYCQRVFRDTFMECARHILTHFAMSVSSGRGNLSPPRRTLTIEVKQVMMPLRREELPPFDEKHNSNGMRDEMLTLFRLQDNGQLNANAEKLVRSRVAQLQSLMAANNP